MDYQTFIFTLIFAHFIADYAIQTEWIHKNKRIGYWTMIAHCSIYTGCTGLALIKWLDYVNWCAIATLFISHFIIDKIRISEKARELLDIKYGWRHQWIPTFVDQFLHFCILLVIIIQYR